MWNEKTKKNIDRKDKETNIIKRQMKSQNKETKKQLD